MEAADWPFIFSMPSARGPETLEWNWKNNGCERDICQEQLQNLQNLLLSHGSDEYYSSDIKSLKEHFKSHYAKRKQSRPVKIPDELNEALEEKFMEGKQNDVTIQPGAVYREFFENSGKFCQSWFYKAILSSQRIKAEYSRFQKKSPSVKLKVGEEIISGVKVITEAQREEFYEEFIALCSEDRDYTE